MSDLPITVFVFPLIAFAVLGFMVYQRFVAHPRKMAQQDQDWSQYRAAELARRLGLDVVAGDPAFNLFITQSNADMSRGPADGRPVHVEITLRGQPRGLPTELYFLHRHEQETGFGSVTWRYWSDCRLSVKTNQAFPPFEVLSRSAPLGPIDRKLSLPSMSTGNPEVDRVYEVCTSEPALAKLLGDALPGFATFANAGVHLVGDGTSVAYVMSPKKAPLLANALYYAETMGEQVTAVARRVGG